ncbi:N/A [soil metagenome]
MKKITIFDSSYTTDNLGDQIIMRSVDAHLREIFPQGFFTGIPSHDYPGKHGVQAAASCDLSFVGGTNILASHWLRYHQIKLRLRDIAKIKPLILMGVGWHKYQRDPDPFTRQVHKRLFNRTFSHSARDRYTYDKLKRSGIENVIYTACPTMWNLSPEHMGGITTKKADDVLFALTAYLRNPALDRQFIEILIDRYREVLFWPQMYDDMAYLQEIAGEFIEAGKITVVKPSVDAVEAAFQRGNIDYIGLRLHCGVLALQNKVRSLIVVVDNRAAEISGDTGLPTIKREEFDLLNAWIDGSAPVRLNLPLDDIAAWKNQFASHI